MDDFDGTIPVNLRAVKFTICLRKRFAGLSHEMLNGSCLYFLLKTGYIKLSVNFLHFGLRKRIK